MLQKKFSGIGLTWWDCRVCVWSQGWGWGNMEFWGTGPGWQGGNVSCIIQVVVCQHTNTWTLETNVCFIGSTEHSNKNKTGPIYVINIFDHFVVHAF